MPALHLIRHASAGRRDPGSLDDDLRALDSHGLDQALRLADHLAERPIARILSSPILRCRMTVQPLADKLGLPVEIEPRLIEGAPVGGVLDLVEELAAQEIALCTHGDIVPDAIRALTGRGMTVHGPVGYAKGGVWTLSSDGTRIVGGEYLAL